MHRKVSLSLDSELVSQLDRAASQLSISRSALVNSMLSDMISGATDFFNQVPLPLSNDPADIRRFRGESIDFVHTQLSSLLGELDSLTTETTPDSSDADLQDA